MQPLARLLLAALLAVGVGAAGVAPVSAGTATVEAPRGLPLPVSIPGVGGPCDIPGIDRACDAVGGVLGHLPNPVTGAVDLATGAAETSLTHWLADGAASVLGAVLQATGTTLTPDLGPSSAFAAQLRRMASLGGGIALLFLLIAVGHALLRGDPGLIVSAVAVRLPLAFGVTTALLFLTATAMAAADQATSYVTGGSLEQSAAQFMQNFSDGFRGDFGQTSLAVVALCALLTILVGLLLYIELVVRAAVIYLVLLFLPLGLAASVWSGAARMARRLADILVTAILSKFVIVSALWLGGGLLAQASTQGLSGGFGTFVIGLVVILLAAGAPLVLLGLVSHAEHAVAAVADTRRATATVSRRGAERVSAGGRAALAFAGAGATPRTGIVDGGGRPGPRPPGGAGGGGAQRSADASRATPVVSGRGAAGTGS